MKRFVMAVVTLGLCAGPAQAAPGSLDRSFGGDGLVHADVGGTDFPKAVLVDPRGRIVIAGWTDVKPPADGRYDFGELDLGLVRYTRRGQLDRSFGGDGRVAVNLRAQERLSALARQPDGKLVVAGQWTTGKARYFQLAVARLTEEGQRDPDFGGGQGWTKLTVDDGSHWLTPELIHVLPDGRLLVFGRTDDGTIFAARLLRDGRPDESFGPSGVRSRPFGEPGSWPGAFVVDSRGGLVVAGSGPPAYLDAPTTGIVQRFSFDLLEDTTGFGSGGRVELGVYERGPRAIALQGDAIVIAISSGSYGFEGQLMRLTPAGTIDGSFGTHGIASVISPASLAVDAAGRLLVGGEFPGMVRYTANGALDTRFRGTEPRYSYAAEISGTLAMATSSRAIYGVGAKLARPIIDFEPGDYDFGLVKLHGGDDADSPRLYVRARTRRCVRATLRLRLRARDASGVSELVVRLDDRLVGRRRGAPKSLRLRTRHLRPGQHRLTVTAVDTVENRTVRTLRFRRCR